MREWEFGESHVVRRFYHLVGYFNHVSKKAAPSSAVEQKMKTFILQREPDAFPTFHSSENFKQ